ncbi:DUF262 domain-containing protein [Mucilaginibacter gracilis]|uniref:DUF262 domain-containing protein n=1 Tax=Mucilaginibacter gracilis TaxID=423350 RepID=UPI001B87F8B6|nr:DUF262 domain-containing protein [Mucilaginibacter gracilis]
MKLLELQLHDNIKELEMENNSNKEQSALALTATLPDPTNAEIELEKLDSNVPLMDKPFDPTMIKIDTKTPSLDTLIERIELKEVELETESYFQRNPDLWDDTKKSRLIESILIQFPLPAFYFDGTDNRKWLVVDGLQRLSSIRSFVVDKTLKLTNLEFLTTLNGKGYDDLGRDLQRIIKNAQVVVYIILPGTPTDVKYNIFKRINTGGLILVPQEIRHALFQGAPANFIAQLALTPSFVNATGRSIKTERMLDRDFANRFLAFYYLGYDSYQPDLDTYMSKAMAAVHTMSEDQKDEIKNAYDRSMQLNIDIFGKHAFRKFENINDGRSPINKALFDVFSVSFAKLTEGEMTLIKDRKDKFIEDFINLLYHDVDNTFFWAVTSSTSDKYRVQYRYQKVQELITSTINS